jgi:hypothetical protein
MKIFISYRRDDSGGFAGWLFKLLTIHFGEESIFQDIRTIEPGDSFEKVIKDKVATCDIVLAMIGNQWLNIKDGQGQRRLDDPGDWLRVEIANALRDPKIRLIPVLVGGARMPKREELPEELKELASHQAIELDPSDFEHDVSTLIEKIEHFARDIGDKAPQTDTPKPNPWGMITAGIIALGLLIGLMGYGLKIIWPTPTATLPSTDAPVVSTWTPSLTPSTSATSPAPPTWTPSFTPSSTSAPIPAGPLSAEVRALDQYYKYINSAVKYKDLSKAWDLLTKNYQCSANNCELTDFQGWWWPRKVHYKLYDCGSTSVDTELVYYGRDSVNAATPTAPIYIKYRLVKDHGQLKIDAGSRIEKPAAGCKLVVSVQ